MLQKLHRVLNANSFDLSHLRLAVYLFKKSLFLLTAITLRFSPKPNLSEEDQPPNLGDVHFPLPGIADLPIFADNVIPSSSFLC